MECSARQQDHQSRMEPVQAIQTNRQKEGHRERQDKRHLHAQVMKGVVRTSRCAAPMSIDSAVCSIYVRLSVADVR